jgi:hypothetical protein
LDKRASWWQCDLEERGDCHHGYPLLGPFFNSPESDYSLSW